MTGEEYLIKVVSNHKAPNLTFYDPRLTAIKNVLRKWAGIYLSEIKLAGSCVKNTAIRGRADCDLFISLISSTPQTLKEIFDNLDEYVTNAGYSTRRQNVSIRINTNGLDIDLVPAKIQSGYKNYHSLYLSKKDTWTQTNIDLNIQNVNLSGRQAEIMATKIWKYCHKLKFPSIYIDLVVVQALKYKNKGQLEKNFITVLEYLNDSFISLKFVDPANSQNVISDLLYKYQKVEIQNIAKQCLAEQNWKSIIW